MKKMNATLFEHGYLGYGGRRYDWVDPFCTRTPEDHPYSYSAHYLWRTFADDAKPPGMAAIYSDRMARWDHDKYRAAMQGRGFIEGLSRQACEEVIESYHDGKFRCVGYAVCCNVSSGYPIGIFFIVPA